eukprot:3937790-Rhodomonas_salina.1
MAWEVWEELQVACSRIRRCHIASLRGRGKDIRRAVLAYVRCNCFRCTVPKRMGLMPQCLEVRTMRGRELLPQCAALMVISSVTSCRGLVLVPTRISVHGSDHTVRYRTISLMPEHDSDAGVGIRRKKCMSHLTEFDWGARMLTLLANL